MQLFCQKKFVLNLKNNINQIVISADHYEKETYEILKNSNFEKF